MIGAYEPREKSQIDSLYGHNKF